MSNKDDERLRKTTIAFLKDFAEQGYENAVECIEWLEKQGEQKSIDMVEPKFHEGDWIITDKNHIWYVDEDCSTTGYLYRLVAINGKVEVAECEVVDKHARLWTIQDAKEGDVVFYRGNVKHSDGIKYERICLFNNLNNAFFTLTKTSNYVEEYDIDVNIDYLDNTVPATKGQRDLLYVTMKEAGYEWDSEKKKLKKIEQNSTDKIEPKFKVGDWITDGYLHCKISDVLDDRYIVDTKFEPKRSAILFRYENNYHLWSINDAKDGDILFQDLMCGKTFIYNGINPDMAILYSFLISNDGEDVLPYHIGKPNTGIGFIEENKNIIHPATKEQRELLFAKMKEAGYEWDGEKKEVKKIEAPIL